MHYYSATCTVRCSPPLQPEVLIFEYKHCSERSIRAAQARLLRACTGYEGHAFATGENLFFLRRRQQDACIL